MALTCLTNADKLLCAFDVVAGWQLGHTPLTRSEVEEAVPFLYYDESRKQHHADIKNLRRDKLLEWADEQKRVNKFTEDGLQRSLRIFKVVMSHTTLPCSRKCNEKSLS